MPPAQLPDGSGSDLRWNSRRSCRPGRCDRSWSRRLASYEDPGVTHVLQGGLSWAHLRWPADVVESAGQSYSGPSGASSDSQDSSPSNRFLRAATKAPWRGRAARSAICAASGHTSPRWTGTPAPLTPSGSCRRSRVIVPRWRMPPRAVGRRGRYPRRQDGSAPRSCGSPTALPSPVGPRRPPVLPTVPGRRSSRCRSYSRTRPP